MAATEEERAVSARTVKAGNIKPPWEVREIPEPPPISLKGLFQWAGPAVILGALAVGGFEAYHAGYMGAKMFLGIFWLYLVSSFCQFFLNQEIARYTIATGETVLQGFSRLGPAKVWPWVSAIFCWFNVAWPAWITGAAAGAAVVFGFGTWQAWSVVALVMVFIVFAASKYVYSTLEVIMYASFLVANIGLALFTIKMSSSAAALEAAKGWLSFGYFPAGITLAMIGPFLVQPAGGFWNFWHTYWVREKGMGMGKYFGRVTGLGYKPEDISRTGYIFDAEDRGELAKFRKWLRLNNLTLIVFFIILGGILFTYFVSLAGYSAKTLYHMDVPSGWKIAVVMSEIFKSAFGKFGFIFFGVILIFALFDTQFSVYDGVSRMFSDAIFLEHPRTLGKRSYRFWYFIMLGILVIYGVIGTFLKTPYFIWLITNWVGAAGQAYVTFMVITLNRKLLPKEIRPKGFPLAVNLIWASVLLLYFLVWTFKDRPF
ncbi:MAG: Nramp family divalent metal transporter [candidate division NC10 bacterium]|nr:Nramp family divalent metal transporter [candidate division NC10 bacterium]